MATGIGEDLFEGARMAVSQMIEQLARMHNISFVAHMLCSICGDLRISGIVDKPNWVASFCFPRLVLE